MRILNRVIYSRMKPCKLRPLPPEIWLLVFETGDLDINDMSNVRLTCALFAALGKIQTFSSLKISPLVLCGDYVNYPKSLANYFADKLRKRLEFLVSDNIAPLVRHCRIEPLYHTPQQASIFDPRRDVSSLIDTIFLTLPRFFNISRLECYHCPVSDQTLNSLSRLRKLSTLEVTDCTITAKAAPRPTLKITNIHFYSHSSTYGSAEKHGNVGWLDVLNPDLIRHIRISFREPKVIHLRGIATTRSLYDLSTPESDHVSRHIISILSHPSALERLEILPYELGSCPVNLEPPGDYALGALSLRSLRDYYGPHDLLSWMSTGPNLRSVNLVTLDNSHYASSRALLKTIQQEAIGNCIHSLQFSVNNIPDVLLMAISTRFSYIRVLRVCAERVNEDEVSLYFLER